MRYKVTYKDGHQAEFWADNINEARREARKYGEVEQIICDYSSIFEDFINTIKTL